MTQPTDAELREQIKTMLDNTILDWNRPSQLTAINADTNYDKLIPAIMQLIATERQQLKERVLEVSESMLTDVHPIGNQRSVDAVPVQAIERVFEGSE